MSGENQRQDNLALDENNSGTSGTIGGVNSPVTCIAKVCDQYESKPGGRCGFVVAPGSSQPFCDAPALPGSSYCARHHALCAVKPDSDEAARLLRDQDSAAARAGPPPPELGFLAAGDPPERIEENDAEKLAGLDL
ncbi:MAG TPA: hypothetical protein VK690_05125, partial [Stellaceae bacterium]|nr:hypothetical protein [Stellaceae bacterium]